MTVMAAEAGAAEATAGASEASAGARKAVANRPRVQRGSQQRPAGSQRAAQGRAGGTQRQSETVRRVRQAAPSKSANRTSYQAVVLGEFVAAVLLVAATPFAKKDSPGISPYAASDLMQLVAITGVYFILALVSGANRGAGRFAAWFGFLILLTVGIGEAARLARLLNVFGLQPSPQDQASTGAGGQLA